MVGAAGVVAEDLAGLLADEERTEVGQLFQNALILQDNLEMLGSERIGHIYDLVHVIHKDHFAVIVPGYPGDLFGIQELQFLLYRFDDGLSQLAAGGDEDALGHLVVLGLGQKIGGENLRVSGLVRQHQDFAGACKEIDANLAVALALGLRHILVAGADDDIHRFDLICSVSVGCDAVGAAGDVDLIGTCNIHGDQGLRIDISGALHGGSAGGNPLYAGHLRGNNQHEGSRKQRIGAAGHIAAAGGDRNHPVSQGRAGDNAEVIQRLHALKLGLGKGSDIGGSLLQVGDFLLGQLGIGSLNLLRGNPELLSGILVKLCIVFQDGPVALLPDVLNNRCNLLGDTSQLLGSAGDGSLEIFHGSSPLSLR